MYDICITMVNTNEEEDIKRCLSSLFADSVDSVLKTTVVIVDNNSVNNIEPMLQQHFPGTTLIRQKKNEGFGKSHNKAMSAVDATYYFVLNPDTTFENGQGFLKKSFDFMEAHSKVGMMGPKIYYPDGSLQYSCYRFPTFLQPIYSRTSLGKKGRGKIIADHFVMKDFGHNKTQPVDWIMGSAMFARKQAINDVGMFDNRFWMYAEDSDWCRRMWEGHWSVYYVHDIVLSHVHKRASAKVPGIVNALLKNRYARQHLKSWLKYFWKWRGNHKYYA
jgi:GT2 family glycosyltransferase